MEGYGNGPDSFSYIHKSRATFIIDPQNFWAQLGLEENFTELEKFEDLIQEHCAEQEQISDLVLQKKFLEKKVVFAKSPKHGKWLRAEVARIAQENIDVYYLDYGTSELVSLDNVCVDVPAHFSSPQPYAYRCQLAGIAPIAKSWTSRAVKCFKSLTLDKLLDALVLPSALLYGTCNVALYAGSSHNHRSISHLLLDEEVGLPLGIENIPEFSHQVTPEWYQQMFTQAEYSGMQEEWTENCEESDGACTSSPGSVVNSTTSPPSDQDLNNISESPKYKSKSPILLNDKPPENVPLSCPISPGSEVMNSPGPPLRIPSFDTNTMELSHNVTAEVLKITAVIESQKSNRTLYKQQLRDINDDLQAELELYGVTPSSYGVSPEKEPQNIVENIHSQIREAANSSPTSDEQTRNMKTENEKPVVHQCKTFTNSNRRRGSGRKSSPHHSPTPSVGRGRARNRNRSCSNSPVCMDHRCNDGTTVKNKDGYSKPENQDYLQSVGDVKNTSPLTVKEFEENLQKVLDRTLTDDFEKGKEEFISLVRENDHEGRVAIVIEAVLEKAIKLYDSFCPAAIKLLAVCEDMVGFAESLSSVLNKLQSKCIKPRPANAYAHINYSRVLGQLFLSSLNWNKSTCVSLRVCVINSLQKWIIFNKNGSHLSPPPIEEKFMECFLELWSKVGQSLHSAMFGEWQILVEEIKQKVISDSKDLKMKRTFLDALLTSVKLTNQSKIPADNQRTEEIQTTPNGCDKICQTPAISTSDASCQVYHLTVKTPDKGKGFLITPDELEKLGNKENFNYHVPDLHSPEHFVVPRFTVPLSPDQLSADDRLSPIPLVYSRCSPALERLSKAGTVNPPISARGRRNSQSKPFFNPNSTFQGLPNRYEATTQLNNSYSALYKRSTPQSSRTAEFCPPLMTPDLFSPPSDYHYQDKTIDKDSPIEPNQDGSLKIGSNSPFVEIVNPDVLAIATNKKYDQNNSSKISQNPPTKDSSSMFKDSDSDILLQNLGAKKPKESSSKKKQLVDLSTGQVLGQSQRVEKPATVKDTTSSSSFSYAAILSAAKQNAENQSQNKLPLTMKNIAMDLLKEPNVSENCPEVTSNEWVPQQGAEQSTQKPELQGLASSPWVNVKTKDTWVADSEEFPSLADVQGEKHSKLPPNKVNERENKAARDGAFSEDDSDSDDDYDDWELRYDASVDVKPQPIKKPLWVPGPRKCTICGDLSHLIYDCPKKNTNFLL